VRRGSDSGSARYDKWLGRRDMTGDAAAVIIDLSKICLRSRAIGAASASTL